MGYATYASNDTFGNLDPPGPAAAGRSTVMPHQPSRTFRAPAQRPARYGRKGALPRPTRRGDTLWATLFTMPSRRARNTTSNSP
ncbi:hypothetical protein FRAAL3049 [Frankia alni ACN14a]|uniref:Uncharacterized protein n=1 Tax=Frankia alni (strain DSM 45986 / CECT 9034 / ACN14a) TaxID=326424 RepID=Q0RLB2_FRAAA|nr:hypothetical protein FRAAL3049 [Frankia alni ACN14a]